MGAGSNPQCGTCQNTEFEYFGRQSKLMGFARLSLNLILFENVIYNELNFQLSTNYMDHHSRGLGGA
jgi:hypothetical protein